MARSGSVLFVESQEKIARVFLVGNNKIMKRRESVISTDSEGIGGSACFGTSWSFSKVDDCHPRFDHVWKLMGEVDTTSFYTV